MAYYKPITRTMSIDTINVKTQPSDIYKNLMETDIEITEAEILGLITWYSEKKFEEDNCDEYSITENGKIVLTIKKPKEEITQKLWVC